MPQTLFDKIWDDHLVARRSDGRELIYIDRHVLHELHAPHAFEELAKQQRPVRRPDLTFSAMDHTVATKPGRDDHTNPSGRGVSQGDARGQRPEQHQGVRSSRSRAGHFSRRRARAWHGVARRDACGARQPRQHGRRIGSPGVRLRNDRARAYSRDASHRDEAAEADADPARRQTGPACHRQGCRPSKSLRKSASPARGATSSNMPGRRSPPCRSSSA